MSTTGLRPWSDYVDLIRQQEELIGLTWKPEDKQYRADFYRQLLMNLSYAYVQYFQSNPDHPEFMPLWNSVYLFQPNPDDVYYYAPLDGRKRYRIVGDRGSIHMVMFQFGKGMMGMVEPGGGQQHSSYLDEKDLVVGADGAEPRPWLKVRFGNGDGVGRDEMTLVRGHVELEDLV